MKDLFSRKGLAREITTDCRRITSSNETVLHQRFGGLVTVKCVQHTNSYINMTQHSRTCSYLHNQGYRMFGNSSLFQQHQHQLAHDQHPNASDHVHEDIGGFFDPISPLYNHHYNQDQAMSLLDTICHTIVATVYTLKFRMTSPRMTVALPTTAQVPESCNVPKDHPDHSRDGEVSSTSSVLAAGASSRHHYLEHELDEFITLGDAMFAELDSIGDHSNINAGQYHVDMLGRRQTYGGQFKEVNGEEVERELHDREVVR